MSPVARVVLRRTRTHTHKRDEEFADAVVLGQFVKCGDSISEVVRRDDAGGAMLFTYCNAYCPPD
jgi:hypothetical protein